MVKKQLNNNKDFSDEQIRFTDSGDSMTIQICIYSDAEKEAGKDIQTLKELKEELENHPEYTCS